MNEPTVEELAQYNDDALLALWHEEACNMSYFNAAEAPQWGRELAARERCKDRFNRVNKEVERRGLVVNKRGYLL